MNATLLFLPLLFVLGYFLLIRPQQQRIRRQQALQRSISVGDEVVTVGGMIGRVSSLEEDRVWLELAPGTRVVFLRQAISHRLSEPRDAEQGHDVLDYQPGDEVLDNEPGDYQPGDCEPRDEKGPETDGQGEARAG